jgi:hypothetical protein
MNVVVTIAVALLAIGWIAFVFLRWPPRNRRPNPRRPARRPRWGVPFFVGGTGSATDESQDGTGNDWSGGDWGGGTWGGHDSGSGGWGGGDWGGSGGGGGGDGGGGGSD